MTRPLKALTVIVLLGSLMLVATSRPLHAAPAEATTSRPQSNPQPTIDRLPARPTADIGCDTSPFGRVLTLGGDNEIFVGYAGGLNTPQANWLSYTRLDTGTGDSLVAGQTWSGGSDDVALRNVRWPTAAAADLNGDGKVEYAQAAIDASGAYRVVAHRNGAADDGWRNSSINNQQLAMTAGNLTRNVVGHDRLAIASRSAIGSLDLIILTGSADGGIGNDDLQTLGLWRSNQTGRENAQDIRVTNADLDGDGFDDEIIVLFREANAPFLHLLVLEYDPTIDELIDASNIQRRIRAIGDYGFEPGGTILSLALASGDLDGDYRDEIVVAWDNERPARDGISDTTRIRSWSFTPGTPATSPGTFTEKGSFVDTSATQGLGLAVGDTDRDGADEIAVAHTVFSGTAQLTLQTLDAELAKIVVHNTWQSADQQRGTVEELVLEAGDLDRDGAADLVAAFRDYGNVVQVLRLADQAVPDKGLVFKGSWRDGGDGRTGASKITVDLADWDNDSIKAHYESASGSALRCKQVTEPQITAAVFRPPFWSKIQGSAYIYGSIGESSAVAQTDATAYTTFHSHSASAYFGGGVDGEAFSAIARVTAGYEYSASQTRSGETNTGERTSEGWTNASGDFVVVDKTIYNCYSYQLKTGAQALDSVMRFCEYKDLSQEAPTLDVWDTQDSPVNNPEALQWAPVGRDWSSLALLRGEHTAQSTTNGGRAAHAVDGNTSGVLADQSATQTGSEVAPWWQVDLGSSQVLTKIRVWNRTDTVCGAQPCGTRLHNFNVFVSDTDFRTISNDPAKLKADPRVKTYTHTGPTGAVATIVTIDSNLKPQRGRFLRVQLGGTGVLSLAEVQVFGNNHVEPDRYPVAVRDPDGRTVKGTYVPGTDGWFETTMFLQATGVFTQVRTRGNLLWNGAEHGVLANKTVGPGDGIPTWSLAKDYGGSETTAQELTHSASIGAEFDLEAGVFGKVVGGGGYEFTSGLTTEHAQKTSWTKSFEIGGGVQGFPTRVDGQAVLWPDQCKYQFQPYYYEVVEQSDVGYAHKMLVIDYIVPQFLDRSKNMAPCRAGEFRTSVNVAPVAVDDTVATGVNQAVIINVLANDTDGNSDPLTITAVGRPKHGTLTNTASSITYTPASGFVGSDLFTYTISDGLAGSTATVRVNVGGSGRHMLFLPFASR